MTRLPAPLAYVVGELREELRQPDLTAMQRHCNNAEVAMDALRGLVVETPVIASAIDRVLAALAAMAATVTRSGPTVTDRLRRQHKDVLAALDVLQSALAEARPSARSVETGLGW